MSNQNDDKNPRRAYVKFDDEGVITVIIKKADLGSMGEINGKMLSLTGDSDVVALMEDINDELKTQLLEYLAAAKTREVIIISVGIKPAEPNEAIPDALISGYSQEEIERAISILNLTKAGFGARGGERVFGGGSPGNKDIAHDASQNDKGNRSVVQHDKSGNRFHDPNRGGGGGKGGERTLG